MGINAFVTLRPDCKVKAGEPPPTWCQNWCGASPKFPGWDTGNLQALLQHVHHRCHDSGYGPAAFELGNELAGNHLPFDAIADESVTAASLLAEIWGGSRRPLNQWLRLQRSRARIQTGLTMDGLLSNVSRHVRALSYHSYPATSADLMNAT
jgi:hypothetical protein